MEAVFVILYLLYTPLRFMKRPVMFYFVFSGVFAVLILLAVLATIEKPSSTSITEESKRAEEEEMLTLDSMEETLQEHADLFSHVVRLEPQGYGVNVLETNIVQEPETEYSGYSTLIELWNVSDTQKITKLHEFSLPSDCASFDWDIFQGYLRVTEKTSPCEAFEEYRTFYYWLPSGELAKKMEWSEPGGDLVFQRGKVRETISLTVESSVCVQDEEGGSESLSQVLLTGLNIKKEEEEVFIPLESSLLVECQMEYGGYRSLPGISWPESTDGFDGGSDFIRFNIGTSNESLSAVLLFPGREEDLVFKIE